MFTATAQQNTISGTTFSGQAPLSEKVPTSLYFLMGGLLILALISIGLTGFAFYERDIFQKKVEAKKEELLKINYNQEGATLQSMEDLSGRLKGVVSIFTSAPSASSIFTIIESAVERGVTLTSISTKRIEGTKNYTVTIVGKANTYRDLILQRDTLRLAPYSKYVSNVIVVSFTRDIDLGNVPFTMTMIINVGRFQTSNLLVDLTRPTEAQVPKITAPHTPVAATTALSASSTSTLPLKVVDSSVGTTTAKSAMVASTTVVTPSNGKITTP